MTRNPAAGPSQRQLRVGEEIRHALAEIFAREALHDPALHDVSLTFSEVRISPDLKNATVFFLPLGGGEIDAIRKGLGRAAPHIRGLLGRHVRLRVLPRLKFVPDESFARAETIDRVLRRVAEAHPGDLADDADDGAASDLEQE